MSQALAPQQAVSKSNHVFNLFLKNFFLFEGDIWGESFSDNDLMICTPIQKESVKCQGKILPGAQRAQGIASESQMISTASFHFS